MYIFSMCMHVHSMLIHSRIIVRSYFQCIKPWKTVVKVHLYIYRYDYDTLAFCSLPDWLQRHVAKWAYEQSILLHSYKI